MQHLQPNTTLQGGKYRIERVLGQGGFGNTYVGYNTESEEVVAIKEFFMKGVTERDETTCAVSVSNADNVRQFEEQREKFKKEALRIRKLENPHIVRVHDLFEENGTSYYVMDFVDGENLTQRLKRTGKPMAERKVRDIIPQLLDALKAVHDAGMWHLDIKPANIMLDKNGNVKLIDFGASKQLNAQKGGATASTAISYTNGYAPREQMEQNYDKFGPWTDSYALGATLYNLLTNKRPPMPSDIDDDISEDKHNALPFPTTTSTEMKQFVVQMMQTNWMKRPQTIAGITILSRKKMNHNVKSEETTLMGSSDSKSDEETVIMPKEKRTVYIAEAAEPEGSSVWKYVVAGMIAFVITIVGYNLYEGSQTSLPPAAPVPVDTASLVQDTIQEEPITDAEPKQKGSETFIIEGMNGENQVKYKQTYVINVEDGTISWSFKDGKESRNGSFKCNPQIDADIIIAECKSVIYWGEASHYFWFMSEEFGSYRYEEFKLGKKALGLSASYMSQARKTCPNAFEHVQTMYNQLVNSENGGDLWGEIQTLSYALGEYPLEPCDLYDCSFI